MNWFKKEWLSSDSKALGIYMALLLLLRYSKEKSKQKVSEEIEKVVKGEERSEAWEVVNEFIETFDSLYHDNLEEGRKALEELEKKYYERFKKACYKYLNKNIIEKYKKYRKYIAKVLRKIKAGECGRFGVYKTSCGSIYHYKLDTEYLRDVSMRAGKIGEVYNLIILTIPYFSIKECMNHEEEKYAREVYDFLSYSRILWFDEIIPAPYLEDEFIEKLERGEEIIVEGEKEAIAEGREKVAIPVKEEEDKSIELYKDKKPSREILESIVANVLERFGFKVETNKMAKAKEGREIEVDVWGIKTIGNTRFYVYASCKNWNRKVDRDVIFSEIGRVSKLIQQPHLKIFVCKELTDPARESALTDGFTVIELKEKANSENADEIAKIIYNHLNNLFPRNATPELQRITEDKVKNK